ncbi:MAG: hypothetical protein IT299_09180 [Dehalococcoidia bacterium]|nr:hypothetical protein [Dehalococcoidia bacterium]
MSRWLQVLRRLRWRHYVVFVALLFFLAFGMMQIARAFGHARGFREPPDLPAAEWMTIRQVSHIYDVPPDLLERALGLPERQPDRRPLGVIARDQGRSFEEVRDVVMQAIAAHHAAEAPPKGPTPPAPDRPR